MNNGHQIAAFVTLLAPLVSFLTVCLTAKNHLRTISVLALLFTLTGFISALVLAFQAWDNPVIVNIEWFAISGTSMGADIAISNNSLLMIVVVSLISFLVHVYSIDYMHRDANIRRYFAMLGFFTFSMQGIVLSDNLLFMFIFWELVGFSSYLLIGHWTEKPEAARAASKAFIMNRIGDAGFLVGLMILWTTNETFSLTEILRSPVDTPWQTAASLCLFCGVIGKSAQFPLFTWLPDAMEGPTPVSALIHAATMVAAGVYLLVRVYELFTPHALQVVALTGMITTLIGALAAISQYDIKKILAFSTMSQLGLMVLAMGMGLPDAAFLHLLTHAFFKACLFLSAGMIIHSLHEVQPPQRVFDEQDIRSMGGLRKRIPVTFAAFLISSASLAGVPFFSGFLSKEAILAGLMTDTQLLSWVMVSVVLCVSLLTAMYTFRMIWFVFFGEETTTRTLEIREPGLAMRIPALLLALCSLWPVVSWNPFNFAGWFTPDDPSPSPLWLTIFSILWVAGGIVLSWFLFRKISFRTIALLRNSFYLDTLYRKVFVRGLQNTSHALAYADKNGIDRGIHGLAYAYVIFAHVVGWIDRTFVDGTVNAVTKLTGFGGKITRSFQGGNIQLYVFWSALAIIIFIIWELK